MASLRPVDESRLNWAQFLVVWVAVVGYVIVVFRAELLPERFSYDAGRIASIARQEGAGDPSFAIVGDIYRALGLAYSETLAGLIQYTIAAGLIVAMFQRSGHRHAGIAQVSVPILALLLSAVYLGHYSKDAFVLPIAYALCLASTSTAGTLTICAVMAVYAATFRTYWWLVLFTFVAALMCYKIRATARSWLLGLVVGAILVAVSIMVTQGMPADAFRSMTNESRDPSTDAATMITPYVSLPEPLGGVVSSVTTAFLLMVPLPLLRLGGMYYVLIAVSVSVLWLTMLVSVHRASPISSLRLRRMLALLLAFLAVQSTFEPDYGSALRHLTPLLGVIIAVISECSATRGLGGVDDQSDIACGGLEKNRSHSWAVTNFRRRLESGREGRFKLRTQQCRG